MLSLLNMNIAVHDKYQITNILRNEPQLLLGIILLPVLKIVDITLELRIDFRIFVLIKHNDTKAS